MSAANIHSKVASTRFLTDLAVVTGDARNAITSVVVDEIITHAEVHARLRPALVDLLLAMVSSVTCKVEHAYLRIQHV